MTAPVTMGQLARWATIADAAGDAAQEAAALLRAGRADEAIPLVEEATEKARLLVGSLENAGAEPAGVRAAPVPLALLDTAFARLLLDMLTRAQDVAEQVDAERGRVLADTVPLLPGESRGVDLAESISHLCERLRLEIHGPDGGGRE